MNLTREQILAEPPGPRLNAWVAEYVMGWTYGPDYVEDLGPVNGWSDANGNPVEIPLFSTDIEAAWIVVGKMKTAAVGPGFELLWGEEEPNDADKVWVAVFGARLAPEQFIVEAYGPTAPLAICRCALLTTLPREQLRHVVGFTYR